MEQDALRLIETAYESHNAQLCKIAYEIVGNRELSKEIVNDVFVQVMKHYRWWTGLPPKAQNDYLHKTCIRLSECALMGENKHSGCRYRDDYDKNNFFTDNSAMLGETISTYVGKLSEPDRQVIDLKYYKDKNTGEIGEICGITRENASQRLHRARKRLKKFMDEEK